MISQQKQQRDTSGPYAGYGDRDKSGGRFFSEGHGFLLDPNTITSEHLTGLPGSAINGPGAFRCLRPGTKNAALKLSVRGGGPRRLESETSSPLRGAFLYPEHAHRSEGWAAR